MNDENKLEKRREAALGWDKPGRIACENCEKLGKQLHDVRNDVQDAKARLFLATTMLDSLLERMDRARNILTSGKPIPDNDWGILDTTLDRKDIKNW